MSRTVLPAFDEFTVNSMDYSIVTVKINHCDLDVFPEKIIQSIEKLLKDLGITIVATVAGYHEEGRKHIPHMHLHYITNSYKCNDSNFPRYKKKFLEKNPECDLGKKGLYETTFKFMKVSDDEPAWQILSYVFKEGIGIDELCTWKGKAMPEDMLIFLKNIGRDIYTTAEANRQRKEAAEDRSRLQLYEMKKYAQQKVEEYGIKDFKSLVIIMDGYVHSQELEKKPDFFRYMPQVIKVGEELNLVKYSELFFKKLNL